MTAELHAMQLSQLNRIEIVLKNMGCSYKIKLPNGNVIQSEPIKPATPKRVRMYPYNEVRNYYKPFVADVQPGQIASRTFRSMIHSKCGMRSGTSRRRTRITRSADVNSAMWAEFASG